LGSVQDFFNVSVIICRTLETHLDLTVLFDEAFDDAADVDVLEFLVAHFEFFLVEFVADQNNRDLHKRLYTVFLMVEMMGSQ
jgi:hypothetical protein